MLAAKISAKGTTIMHPDTLRRWIREAGKRAKCRPAKAGRRKTQEEIRELILKLARENNWGYIRILGEICKLGIKAVSRNTVKAILKGTRARPRGRSAGPARGTSF